MSTKISIQVVNMDGKEVERLDLDADVFGIRPSPSVVHQAVRWQLAKRRSGTHSVKTRSFMKGGGRKPFKQKGTGRARAGSNNSPLWVGGAVVHGPTPRSYEFRFPKSMRRLALASVLSDKLKQARIIVLDRFDVASGKTAEMAGVLAKLGVEKSKALVIADGVTEATQRSAKNIPGLDLLPVAGANVYDLMRHDYLVSTKEGVLALQDRVRTQGTKKAA